MEELRPLITKAQAGDPGAIGELASCADRFVRIFHGSLSRHVRKVSGSTLDFVLEGLSEALAQLEEFHYESDKQFYSWVSHYIRSRIIDAGRREARQRRQGRPAELGDADGAVAGSTPTASAIIGDREMRTRVGQALVATQVRHPLEMEVIVLKLYEDHSWEFIREVLGLSSVKRARTLLAHGLALLRPLVDKEVGTGSFEQLGRSTT